MIDQNLIDQLSQKLSQLLAAAPSAESAKPQLRALLQSALRDVEFVSRDEFDAQTAVLARTRQKLEQLEQQLTELEQQANS